MSNASKPNPQEGQTEKKPTDASGDPVDGSGEDNHRNGKQSPQQVHNDEDHG
jgi:hypothetical protein